MKKLLLSVIVMMLISINAISQEDSNDFNRWQARLRVIAIIPDVDDDLDDAKVDVSTAVVPELDFTYFFDENWAAELILATAKHNVDVNLGTEIDLGHVWILPPTLSLQYHFTGGTVKPYLGAGINYTFFYGIDEGDVVGMDYDDAVGFSMQGGLDFDLNDYWFLNFDIKKLLLKTDVKVNTGDGIIPVEVDINPWVVGVGVGVKF
ncbi:MAG: OmpW family outer membrane protein [Lutibacter sp.]|nr:outer membrane beta-barrel protein [Lutibacter sp.]MDT8416606.1 OmpW family outer membrane protein [Lutibacter sp.]